MKRPLFILTLIICLIASCEEEKVSSGPELVISTDTLIINNEKIETLYLLEKTVKPTP